MTSAATRDPQLEATVAGHKATVRRMLARLSAGDVAGLTDCLAPNYLRHSQAMPPELQENRGKDMMHEWLQSNLVPFPDYHEELEWLVGEGDFVAWRSRGTGTQSGPLGPCPSHEQAHGRRDHWDASLRGRPRRRDVDIVGQSRAVDATGSHGNGRIMRAHA